MEDIEDVPSSNKRPKLDLNVKETSADITTYDVKLGKSDSDTLSVKENIVISEEKFIEENVSFDATASSSENVGASISNMLETKMKAVTESPALSRDGDANLKSQSLRDFTKETDVGITEYVNPRNAGIRGILKQRYSDFLVNEINLCGETLHLTDVSLPIEEKKNLACDVDILSAEELAHLREVNLGNIQSTSISLPSLADKEYRTKVHQTLNSLYPNLYREMVEKDGNRVIVVSIASKHGNNRQRRAKSSGIYLHCLMYKENLDTAQAISNIAQGIGQPPRKFSKYVTYAGTKDKRGKTVQGICIKGGDATRLQGLNKKLTGIKLGNFCYKKEPLKLGQDISGNLFQIVLRNVAGSISDIDKAMLSLKECGFINYYGMQRFGVTKIPTHHIGRAMLLSKWDEAVQLILKPRGTMPSDRCEESRVIWWETQDVAAAKAKLPKRWSVERQLLENLDRKLGKSMERNNYFQAIEMLPRNLRLMYIHSYQSYVWNKIVSKRLRLSVNPIPGDLVTKEGVSVETRLTKHELHTLSSDDVSKYSITDVVLPLPGYDVIYPDNSVTQLYKDVMTEDGLDFHNLKHKVRDYSLPGSYRRVIVKPEGLSWNTTYYNDITQPLFSSDVDKLNGVTLPEPLSDGAFKALKIEMSLPTSSYATMALREVLKTDTSWSHQSTLNKIVDYDNASHDDDDDDTEILEFVDCSESPADL